MAEQVVGVDHVNVTTPEELEAEVVGWYETVLALPRLEKPETTHSRGAWFRAGTQEVHISIDPHNPPKDAHFGLVVNDFAGMVERLRGAGAHIEQASEIPGRHRCYTRDPAGNRIEVIAYVEDPTAAVVYEEPAAGGGGV